MIDLDSDEDSVPEKDCSMDMIYTISLQEEEVRGKLLSTNEAITKLENLIKKTQDQLKKRMSTKETVSIRELFSVILLLTYDL